MGGPPRAILYVDIQVKPHPFFERHERNLSCRVPGLVLAGGPRDRDRDSAARRTPAADDSPRHAAGRDCCGSAAWACPIRTAVAAEISYVEVQVEVPKHPSERSETSCCASWPSSKMSKSLPQRKSFFDKLKDYFAPAERMSPAGKPINDGSNRMAENTNSTQNTRRSRSAGRQERATVQSGRRRPERDSAADDDAASIFAPRAARGGPGGAGRQLQPVPAEPGRAAELPQAGHKKRPKKCASTRRCRWPAICCPRSTTCIGRSPSAEDSKQRQASGQRRQHGGQADRGGAEPAPDRADRCRPANPSTPISTRPCSRCTTDEHPPMTVVHEVERGFTLQDRVVRPPRLSSSPKRRPTPPRKNRKTSTRPKGNNRMPTYDYECKACHHRWELFQSIKAEPEKKCPACGKRQAQRMIGPGAGIIFKGSGFYQTDYRSSAYKKGGRSRQKGLGRSVGKSNGEKSDGGSSKSESKSEPKKSKAARKDRRKANPGVFRVFEGIVMIAPPTLPDLLAGRFGGGDPRSRRRFLSAASGAGRSTCSAGRRENTRIVEPLDPQHVEEEPLSAGRIRLTAGSRSHRDEHFFSRSSASTFVRDRVCSAGAWRRSPFGSCPFPRRPTHGPTRRREIVPLGGRPRRGRSLRLSGSRRIRIEIARL